MTSLFTLEPYYPPWDRSKKSVYQATLLCYKLKDLEETRAKNSISGISEIGQYPESGKKGWANQNG